MTDGMAHFSEARKSFHAALLQRSVLRKNPETGITSNADGGNTYSVRIAAGIIDRLIRNRKGHLPHIAVVTGEPLPSRLASIALGTGDIDCVYHFALLELQETIEELQFLDAQEMLQIMVEGKCLKDIADLPLDLAV